ncbi:hypothetical protein J0X19_01525 [Hymenobacter sp. BT186]|uniref:DUF7033 domain-containing protein n=1 Tax=Hymenobacter telluris TaxID=2816474 RepID=A0A939ESF1_9BACT|nr:hypothetical protein [Hymenobacter telluris]MBO0356613.1 hypothetical protein [Hymenobacter telluris]MBW3372638.1 hypothetical protein [Hymenobacter norwichensis]
MLPPLPLTAPVTAETRLAYVLHHFRQAYEAMPAVTIGYADQRPQVEIVDCAGSFFTEQRPYPADPNMREWQGRQLPVFFDSHPEKPLLELSAPGRARINADVVSAAFYLLSGWQEFFSNERDRHGRFPFSASVQHRYGFVAVPVVNYYFDVLKTAVEHVTSQVIQPRRWVNDAPFATFVTHDIDQLYSAWKAPAKAALRNRNLLQFGRQLWRHFTQPDAWDNLEQVQQTVASYGAKSTFFFLPEHRKSADGTPNADYNIRQKWLKLAAAIGESEVGLHASLGTALHGGQFKQDEHRLQHLRNGVKAYGIRFHYLQWEPRITPTLLCTLRYEYDSTLGFAEHYGFRNSYCLPFQLFDFTTGKSYDFLEIPLNVMDATLHHPNYLQLAPHEILPALQPMFQEIERFGGVCTLLWHNDHFDPANETTGPRQFAELMQYLRSRNTAFVNGTDICGEMVKW